MVRPLEENQELFGAVDLRGAELDFQAERDCLQRLQEAQDPGRADFSLGSPLYLNLFPVRPIMNDRTCMAAGPWCKAGLQPASLQKTRTCRLIAAPLAQGGASWCMSYPHADLLPSSCRLTCSI